MKPEGLDLRSRLSLTVPEAAEALGVSESTVRRHLADGIPVVRMGWRVIIPVAGLSNWLEKRAQGAATAAKAERAEESERDAWVRREADSFS